MWRLAEPCASKSDNYLNSYYEPLGRRVPDDSENQSSSYIITLLKKFTIPGFHNELEGNDEQSKNNKPIETIHSNLKHLEKQIPVNEATSKIVLPVFQSTTHTAGIMEQI